MASVSSSAELSSLFNQLKTYPSEAFDLYQLALDPNFSEFSEQEQLDFARGCTALGKAAAASFDMEALTKRLASWHVKIISVQQSSRPAAAPHHVVARQRSQARLVYHGNSGTIALYVSEIKAAVSSLCKVGLNITEELLTKLLIAHEAYHLLEATTIGKTEDLMPKVRPQSQSRRRVRPKVIRTASELAAHSFARQVSGFPYSPVVCSLVYQSACGALSAEELFERLDALEHIPARLSALSPHSTNLQTPTLSSVGVFIGLCVLLRGNLACVACRPRAMY